MQFIHSRRPEFIDTLPPFSQTAGLQNVVLDVEPETIAPDSFDSSKWEMLVQQIRAGDPLAVEELYRIMNRGIRFILQRQLPFSEVEDKVHDTFIIVLQAIHNDELREPARLLGYIRTVARRQMNSCIGESVKARRNLSHEDSVVVSRHDTEMETISREKSEIMTTAFKALRKVDQEILTRFYLDEQPWRVVCKEMGLTETQFRLCKSRAKKRLTEAGRNILKPRRIPPGREEVQSTHTTGFRKGLSALARVAGIGG